MDRLTFDSIINCVKELDSLEKIILSEKFSHAEIADWVAEISWNLVHVTGRHRRAYKSDEFQHILRKLVKGLKRESLTHLKPLEDDADG